MTEHNKSQQVPLAVVGVSALFPGSLDEGGFWRDILAGRDLLSEVPPGHWLISDFYDPDLKAPDKTYTTRGGFLRDVDFDPMAFGIPPNIIEATDTSQLLGLIVAQRVLEDAAGGDFAHMDRSRISVILGATSAQELLGTMVSRLQRPIWLKSLRDAGIPEAKAQEACQRISDHYVPWQESTFPGLLGNVVAGRIANRLDLGGTNCVTDAACASTFSAVAMAANELYLGQSDMVIAGGVDTMNDIFMYMCFSKTPALSLTGDCRPFSDKADGTMLGEGLGMIALKRLDDAERDGDRIYAVLRGIGSSSDGRSKSVYAPVPEGQAKALRRAYEAAGYSPGTVELVEAHGTGTKAGDLAEFQGLCIAFGESERQDSGWCALGSVKSQIGHTKSAAGAAGLFKIIMALHHKTLPPTIKVERPNPKLNLEQSPFYLNTLARPWVRDARHPRRGSVSSFGFGGSNFHLALEEYTGPAPRAALLRGLAQELVLFAADQPDALLAQIKGLDLGAEGTLRALARSSQEAPPAGVARLAVLARDEAELAQKLTQAAALIAANPRGRASAPQGIDYAFDAKGGPVAFLFPGQGSQYLHMGAQPAMTWPAAARRWEEAAALPLDAELGLHQVVFPPPTFSEAEREAQEARLVQTRWAQPGIGAASLATLALLEQVGLRPAAVAGHSFGEVTALCAAGSLRPEVALRVARRRGELMQEAAAQTQGAMTAVSASLPELRAALEAAGVQIKVANHNAPRQVVLSGTVAQVEAAEAALRGAGLRFQRLQVATAFHSEVVSASAAPFGLFLDGVEVAAPALPVYANAAAAPYEGSAQAVRAGLAAQIAQPVRFVEMIEAMHRDGARVFVEVGPNAVLTRLVGQILEGQPHLAVATDQKGGDGAAALHRALGQLWVEGVPLALGALWEGFAAQPDPRARKKPKMVIPLNGTNYNKPYPPKGGAAALPPPNPEPQPQVIVKEVIKEVIKEVVKEIPVAAPTPARPTAAAPARPAAALAAPPRPGRAPAPLAHTPHREVAMHNNDRLAWIAAYQEAQRQTAEAHMAWQSTMTQAHMAWLHTMESSFSGLTAMVTGQPIALPAAAAPTFTAPPPAPIALQQPAPAPAAPAPAYTNGHSNGYANGAHTNGATAHAPVAAPAPAPVYAAPAPAPIYAAPAPAPVYAAPAPAPVAAPASAKAAPAPAKAAGLNLKGLLLEVVAEKTGYPAEMLNMEMSLEADLGIDSIKRVEILSTMTERAPGLPEVDTGKMAALQTLGQIVDTMQAQLGAAPQEGVHVPFDAAGRYTLEAVAASAPGFATPGLVAARRIIITRDGEGIAEALAAALGAYGLRAEVRDDVPEDADALLSLGGLAPFDGIDAALAIQKRAFAAARALAPRLQRGEAGCFVTVQDTGGDFGLSGSARAWVGGLSALAKTARQEWPQATARAIDLERGGRGAAALAQALCDELMRGGPEPEVGLRADGLRLRLRSVASPVADGADHRSKAVLDHRSVVVASGGARGVTATTLIALARATGARFAVLGRSALPEEPACCRGVEGDAALKRALMEDARAHGEALTPAILGKRVAQILAAREVRGTLEQLRDAGAQVRYVIADVTDRAAIQAALEQLRQDWGPITALVHGAGVLADKLLAQKTDADFDYVFDTKIEGLRALLEATAADPLRLMVLFSSVAARTGNAGQSDYAMANETLNKVAALQRAGRGGACVVKAMGWGPWEGGMVTPALKARFEALGVPLIGLQQGAQALVDEVLRADPAQIELVIGGEPRQEALIADPSAPAPARRYPLWVDAQTHPWLDAHRIQGAPVVPVALALEWFLRAARATHPEVARWTVRDLSVLHGVRLEGFGERGELFEIVAQGDAAQLSLELRDAAGKPRYRATAAPDPQTPLPAIPIGHLEPWGQRALYGDVLFHGPALQVIEAVEGFGPGSAAARVSGLTAAWGQGWAIDLPLIDGGLQVALLWARELMGGRALPLKLGAWRALAAATGRAPARCALRATPTGRDRATCDLLFSDADGPFAALEGVELQIMRDGKLRW
jgi:acyl transferase domain-containing protein